MAASASYVLIELVPLDSNFVLLLQDNGNKDEVITNNIPETRAAIGLCPNKEGPPGFSESWRPSQGSSGPQFMVISGINNHLTDAKLQSSEPSALRKQGEIHHSCGGEGPPSRESAIATRNVVDRAEHEMFTCNVCSASFHLSSHLKAHQVIHIGREVFTCGVCSASFTKQRFLTRHLKTYAGGLCAPQPPPAAVDSAAGAPARVEERPHRCDVCPAAFTQLRQLKVHRLIHTGEKQHECEYCPASFLKLSSLKCHVRTHTGEKPYECRLCPAQFAEPGKLGRHMRTHTGEKPHKCPHCPDAFVQKGNLKIHMKTHIQTLKLKTGQ
ncbi:zinc finger protein 1 homolog [Ornithodoros turicata]|uniref:zinc finger protein 1 homolog n=1 Tax=Ornithodoros turicata TaxID=34597 RepID=UPI0031392A9C